MRVHITQIKVGDRLSKDIYNDYGLNILSSDTILREEEISKLYRHGIDHVDIYRREEPLEFSAANHAITEAFPKLRPHYEDAVSQIRSLFEQASVEGKIQEAVVEASFDPLIENLSQERDVVSLLIQLNSTDDYTYQHSVQVGMISYYIARWMGKTEEEAHIIGKAGYLHDIGKSMIPIQILNKPSKLTNEEYEEIKRHTVFGYEVIQKSLQNQVFALVALEHHERMDGMGYPRQLKGDKLHEYSRIVAVADVYSAMISTRVYQKKRDLLFVLRELHRLSFMELDPIPTQTFIRNMIPSFVGKKVLLRTGETGQIIMTNPMDFFRPLIQIDDKFIDLSKRNELEIDTVYI